MKVFDPLVSFKPSAQAGLRGWAVAAAIIARLQEVGVSGGIDVPAILGPAISDLSESELEELARQFSGPLMDTSRRLLGPQTSDSKPISSITAVGMTSRPPKWIKPQLTRLVDEALRQPVTGTR